jgi:DNA topoisomerase-1
VTDGTTNASLRRGDDPDSISIERASELLADRRAAGPPQKRGRAAKASKTAKKTAKKSTKATKATKAAKAAKTTKKTTKKATKASGAGDTPSA